ncbi:peptidylprolyl isomerase [Planctomycetaceae bacterium]|nr:peptidylprolyl isomerase [Planctomycetaceae bacterium]
MTRRFAIPDQQFNSPVAMATGVVVLAVLLGLTGCRGVPWASTGGETRVVDLAQANSTVADVQLQDAAEVQLASFQLSTPAVDSDWLDGTHVVAIVNGDPIFASEILHRQSRSLAAARQQLSGARYRELQDDLIQKQLKGYVDRSLMSQSMLSGLDQARHEMLDNQLEEVFNEQQLPELLAGRQIQSVVELKRQLAQEGTSLEVLKEDFRQQQLAMEYLRQSARPRTSFSPAEMMQWYRAHLEEFQTTPRVRWRQILVSVTKHGGRAPALKKIESCRRRLVTGESFVELAQEVSDGPAAADGGYWDWTDKESFKDKRISDTLFRLPVGTPSRIFEDDEHFQLVVATEREDGGAAKFETVQDKIEKRLSEENRVQEMERVVQELQATAHVTTVFDRSGAPFFKKPNKPVLNSPAAGPTQSPRNDKQSSSGQSQSKKEIRRERG